MLKPASFQGGHIVCEDYDDSNFIDGLSKFPFCSEIDVYNDYTFSIQRLYIKAFWHLKLLAKSFKINIFNTYTTSTMTLESCVIKQMNINDSDNLGFYNVFGTYKSFKID